MTRYLAALALCLAATTAKADEQAEAQKHFDAAEKAYNVGDFAGALKEYQASYQLFPSPLLLFDMAQCHRFLGENEKAKFEYQRYLDNAPPDDQSRPAAQQLIKQLETTIEQERQSKKSPPTGTAKPGAAPTTEPSSPATAIPAVTNAPAKDTRPWSTRRKIGFGVAVGGVVVAAVGGAMLLAAPAVFSQADTAATLPEHDADHDRGRALQFAGAVVGSIGVVALAAGIIVALTGRREPPRAWIAPTVGGFAVGGSF